MAKIFEVVRTFDIENITTEIEDDRESFHFRVELLKLLDEPVFKFRVLARLHYRIRPSNPALPPDHVPDELIDVEDSHLTQVLKDLTQGNEDDLCRTAAKRILDFFGDQMDFGGHSDTKPPMA